MQTILITGASSDYGLETARHFHERGWNVIATMRSPDQTMLSVAEHLPILPLDVTSVASIAALVEAAGAIDVLVNNAGVGGVGAFEAMPMSLIRQLIKTTRSGRWR